MKKNYSKLLGNFIVANSKRFLFLICIGMVTPTNGQETIVSFTSSTTFTIPEGVTSLKVECWGAGGKGSNVTTASTGTGGGGGGGAYSTSTLCVMPGQTYAVHIGMGGTTSTIDGGDTFFSTVSSVMAKGGKGLSNDAITGAAGGLASQSVGTIKYNGGAGGNRTTYDIVLALGYRSGGGGGGAGSTGTGSNASGITPGASRADNGGSGGAGTDASLLSLLAGFTGNAGNNYGGGGAGAGKGLLLSNPTYFGGNGASGLIRLTYNAYSCATSFNTVWNGNSWSAGLPNACKKAIINGNYNTSVNGSITACNLQINSGSTVTIAPENYIYVYNEIINNGTFIVQNNGSLVQQYSVKANSGGTRVYRTTQPMYRYDFTYWASPVAGVTLHDLSPDTLFDKFFWWNANTQGWIQNTNGTEVMVAGKGYIIRAPQHYSTSPAVKSPFNGLFLGPPHNGTITYPISGDASLQKFNLLGNPYPSAINAQAFLAANSANIGGTLYFWTHSTAPIDNGSGIYSYLTSDYATYNFSGGTAAGSGPAPGNKIGSGQSFFVAGRTNGTVTFTNSMRLINDNSQFFRPIKSPVDEQAGPDEKHRLWLNFSSAGRVFNQILIGYIENATDNLDWGYDGETLSNNQVSFYSLLDTKKLTIQAKALPFKDTDLVPIGYKTTIAGNFNIALDHFDGLFEGDQEVYLKDNLLNVVHDLKEGNYAFQSAVGTFENRFEIAYSSQALETESPVINPYTISIFKDKNTTIVINAGSLLIDQIKIYDLAGRLLHQQNNVNNAMGYVQNFPEQQQLLIVEVLTKDNRKTTKKIIH